MNLKYRGTLGISLKPSRRLRRWTKNRRHAPLPFVYIFTDLTGIVLYQLETTENITVMFSFGRFFTPNPEPLRTQSLVEHFSFVNMAGLAGQLVDMQRHLGERFEYYRMGMRFNPNTAHVQQIIALRPLPYHNIIDAYNVARNQLYTNQRNNKLAWGQFDRVGDPKFNVRKAKARKNQNDMAQALTDFRMRAQIWGLHMGPRLLKCQLKFQRHMNPLLQYYRMTLTSTSRQNPRYWWCVKIQIALNEKWMRVHSFVTYKMHRAVQILILPISSTR